MVKIGICGHYGGNQNCIDGQTVKTKIITKELQKEFGTQEVKCVDTFGGRDRLFSIIIELCKLLVSCENVIILPAHNSLRIFAPLLAVLNCFYNKKLHYIVIGGWLPEFVQSRTWLKKSLMKFHYIYVETNIMKNKLTQIGFDNIVVLPNCKELDILKPEELIYSKEEPYKLCTFSRVMKEKGIEDAIDAVIAINQQIGRVVCSLDIYGQVDINQIKWFEDLKARFPEYIKYKGIVDFNKTTQVLKNYYLLLFPTYYEGEGFAGTIIDAMAAGVPVVASDWRYNTEIIKDKKTGFIIHGSLKEELNALLKNASLIKNIKIETLKEAVKYLPENAIQDLKIRIKY